MNIRGVGLYRQVAGSGLRRAGAAETRQRPSGVQAKRKTGKAALKDKVTISKEGLAAQKKAAEQRAATKSATVQGAAAQKTAVQGMRGRKPAAGAQKPATQGMRGRKQGPGAQKPAAQGVRGRKQGPGRPQQGPPKGVNTGATIKFSERGGVCFVTKG